MKTHLLAVIACLVFPLIDSAEAQVPSTPLAAGPREPAPAPRADPNLEKAALPAALARGILEEEANLNPRGAITNYQAAITQFDAQRRYAATALFRLGACYRKLGQTNEARAQFQRVLREFSDQSEIVALVQAQLPPEQREALANSSDPEISRIKALLLQSPDLINAAGADGETPLQSAAAKGQIEVVRFLLDHGAALDGLSQPNLTALHFAAGNGRLAVVNLLIERGASVEARSSGGARPLHIAVSKGFVQVTKALLDAGAKVNAPAERGAQRSGDNLSYDIPGGSTPLDLAILNSNTNLMELLLARGADLRAKSAQGETPLHLAVRKDQLTAAEVLLRHGADVNARDGSQNTPLHIATAANPKLLDLLIRAKADLNAQNIHGETPLLLAAQNRKQEAAQMLLAAGADPNLGSKVSLTQGSPLPRLGNAPKETPRSGDSSNDSGAGLLTPMTYAVAFKDEALVRDLLEHGAKADGLSTQVTVFSAMPPRTQASGEAPATFLEMACRTGQTGVARLLLKHGADPNHLASEHPPLLGLPSVYGQPELLQLLLEHKADPNASDNSGESPLHDVARGGSTNAVALLVKYGAHVNSRNAYGATPLHYAVLVQRLDLVLALLEAKADPNLMDDGGKTPLDYTKERVAHPHVTPRIVGGATTPPSNPADIAAALRAAGALDEIPHFDRMELRRATSAPAQVIFRKETNEWNQFTLLELVAASYGLISTSQEWRTDERFARSVVVSRMPKEHLPYPDFSRVALRRPTPDGRAWTEKIIDLRREFEAGDCSENNALHWGDVVELPEADHPVNQPWPGLAISTLDNMAKCLARRVEVVSKGQTNVLTVTLDVDQQYVGLRVPLMLRPALLRSNLVLASTDLNRVAVRRPDPVSGQIKEWTFDCSRAETAPKFWLRDGDQVLLRER